MAQHGLDAIIRDRGGGRPDDDPLRMPAQAGVAEPSDRAEDHNEVDTPPRDDRRVEPPALGGAARDSNDHVPFEVTESPVEIKAELGDAGIVAGILNLFG